jgi:hypothetical protein
LQAIHLVIQEKAGTSKFLEPEDFSLLHLTDGFLTDMWRLEGQKVTKIPE